MRKFRFSFLFMIFSVLALDLFAMKRSSDDITPQPTSSSSVTPGLDMDDCISFKDGKKQKQEDSAQPEQMDTGDDAIEDPEIIALTEQMKYMQNKEMYLNKIITDEQAEHFRCEALSLGSQFEYIRYYSLIQVKELMYSEFLQKR